MKAQRDVMKKNIWGMAVVLFAGIPFVATFMAARRVSIADDKSVSSQNEVNVRSVMNLNDRDSWDLNNITPSGTSFVRLDGSDPNGREPAPVRFIRLDNADPNGMAASVMRFVRFDGGDPNGLGQPKASFVRFDGDDPNSLGATSEKWVALNR